MRLINLRLRLVVVLAWCMLSATSLTTIAQPTNSTNAPASRDTRSRDDASELARNVMTTAELAIKASDRALSIMTWLLGICLGGSALGVAGLWIRLSGFMRNVREEMSQSQIKADKLLEDAGRTASVFEQVLRTLPILFVDGIDESNKVVALNTLAQLRRPELAPIFAALLKKVTDTLTQAAAVYALGLLGKDAADWVTEVLRLSYNPDYNLRRECARALAAVGPAKREVRMRLEEMTRDADDIVKELAKRGLETGR